MYSTSHDIRAPLSSLKGLIGLSDRTSDLKEIKDYLRMMNGSVSNLEKFTLNITDHYRNSRADLNIGPLDFKGLLNEVFNSLTFNDSSIKYSFNTDLDDRHTMKTDRERLRVILSNILSNCLKYRNPNTGLLEININYSKNDQFHIIEISDNGIGIGEEHLSKVFNMFYRASDSSHGSGLGLYIVKETVDKLMGIIEVTSALGKGTTFRLELPELRMGEHEPQ
jgi:signal transduction histidine kinase